MHLFVYLFICLFVVLFTVYICSSFDTPRQRRRSAQDELMMREYFQEGDLISVSSILFIFLSCASVSSMHTACAGSNLF